MEDHLRTRQVQKETLVKVDDVVAAQYHLVKLKSKLGSLNCRWNRQMIAWIVQKLTAASQLNQWDALLVSLCHRCQDQLLKVKSAKPTKDI